MATLILNSPQYTVTSYGKGIAYLIERKADHTTFHVQGDEAAQFHDAIFGQDMFDYDVAITQLYNEAFSPMASCRMPRQAAVR